MLSISRFHFRFFKIRQICYFSVTYVTLSRMARKLFRRKRKIILGKYLAFKPSFVDARIAPGEQHGILPNARVRLQPPLQLQKTRLYQTKETHLAPHLRSSCGLLKSRTGFGENCAPLEKSNDFCRHHQHQIRVVCPREMRYNLRQLFLEITRGGFLTRLVLFRQHDQQQQVR